MRRSAAVAKRGGGPAGFTLLEVLLAMAITAMVAVMAYGGLHAAMNAAERHGEQVGRLGEVQTALGWLVRDLRLSVDRPVRDAEGEEQPALRGDAVEEYWLELTRTGWGNQRGQRHGSLQRVRYRLDPDGQLWREHWLVLDRIDDDEQDLQRVRLLSGVNRVALRFLDGKAGDAASRELGGEWVERWPATRGAKLLPLAVEVELDIDGFGTVKRVVGLANEQP
jgi:general secretion pathway protein J